MGHFNEIPYEVFYNFLLPLLSIKEIGTLSMVNKMWNESVEDNEVWKNLYLRTIRANILDTSVHIGGSGSRYYYSNDDTGKPQYIQWDPCNPPVHSTMYYQNSYTLNMRSSVSRCIPPELMRRLKSYKDIRSDNIDSDEFPELEEEFAWGNWAKRDTTEYYAYIKKEWISYNKEKGLSTVNLCQCPYHYEFDTLGIPGGCRNYKSFKKITLKKYLTQIKRDHKKKEKSMKNQKNKYEASLKRTQLLKGMYLKEKADYQKETNLKQNLINAIDSL